MQVKCEYCRQMVDESLEKCPYCGADISGINRMADTQPKTIEELQEWYTSHNLPPEEVTRFFIGKDIKEPKAFGIYKSTGGDFVVYKNKADGTRAIRYQGVDEGYAVNELYQRLRSEIADQKQANQERKAAQPNKMDMFDRMASSSSAGLGCCLSFPMKILGVIIGIVVVAAFIVAIFDKTPTKGYYNYGGQDYYYQDSNWYRYDADHDDWYRADNEDELNEAINSDTQSDYESTWDNDGKDFEESTWYDSGYNSDDNDDWDNDSFWDSDDTWDSGSDSWDSGSDDSWDSGGSDYGGTDWDSDW